MLAIATKLVFSYNVSLPAGRKLDNRWLPITQGTLVCHCQQVHLNKITEAKVLSHLLIKKRVYNF
jgi:hypothetical protein